ncbi:MAG: hypothetical protein HeimC2_34670 [Candidatus Heimdallarchaeota archaeon LC_2]|nr:MAG: hypothetical protein HeimC2_40890 [Candidatus Heimdallarchaeota archaeon LC_2]OLS21169.1 MAG: hypothetical protein HeimC2_34670 [Candidatus Heimdallarchaeota archaeon LC_2]
MTKSNTTNRLVLLIVQAFLITLLFTTPTAANDVVLIAPTYPDLDFSISDDKISDSWDEITTFANLTEFGLGGFAKFAHNETHIYLLLGTTTKSWIAIEFDASADECMETNHDTWIFYINPTEKTLRSVDATFKGLAAPEIDDQNDLFGEVIFNDDLIYIEALRAFNTEDQTSPDIIFSNGSSTFLTFASEENHETTRQPYFFNVQFTDIGSIVEIESPDVINWQEIKEYVLFGAMIFAVFFALTHYIVRQKLRPLEHGSRLIDSNIVTSPKFKERWNTLIHGIKTFEVDADSSTRQNSSDSEGGEN